MNTVISLSSAQLCYFIFRIIFDNQDYLLDYEYDSSTQGEDHLLDPLDPEVELMEQDDVVFMEEVQQEDPDFILACK